MSSIPEVIDARDGAQPHTCRDPWDYTGLNAGGHEIFTCTGGQHRIITAHVAADHQCTGMCASAEVTSVGAITRAQIAAEHRAGYHHGACSETCPGREPGQQV